MFRQNSKCDGIYFVITGKAKIIKNDNQPAQTILYFAEPGDVLGMHAVINEHDFTSSAVAMVNTIVCFIPAKEFRVLISLNNKYKLDVMQLLCSNIDLIENTISSRQDKSTSERFAEVLVLLMNTFGLSEDNELKIDMNHDDLANLAGTSRAYLNKIIQDFSQKEWISIKGNIIKILNRDFLEREVKV